MPCIIPEGDLVQVILGASGYNAAQPVTPETDALRHALSTNILSRLDIERILVAE